MRAFSWSVFVFVLLASGVLVGADYLKHLDGCLAANYRHAVVTRNKAMLRYWCVDEVGKPWRYFIAVQNPRREG